jgi:hypothetical protein
VTICAAYGDTLDAEVIGRTLVDLEPALEQMDLVDRVRSRWQLDWHVCSSFRAAASLHTHCCRGSLMWRGAPKLRTPELIVGLVVAMCAGSGTRGSAQFTSFNNRTRSILEGNWQSCRESDGNYSERIYDGNVPGLGPFELHLGPYHDFALFRGVQDDHRDHDAPDNFLRPHTVDVRNNTGTQSWHVAGLRFDVTLAGGSREECESWWIVLRRVDPSSH